ncbi:uncharacterized protein PHALS_10943 [Plasmopara halstedii]|uniref:Uncharacterized protein n=1 Tax=Plasmopara halstedii TaxID=4781 RepID=A0A0P1AIA8_PLAHL|nr:uncharacterized protein PHALS_10943 [Plasmopara halstedii]CEG40759.1 hypothetical protein PHALS_10943 [Plasmopara halstedii]|eukprot:XP_024577128.1 hypothetical protein PHALS_10943 [Plasmopara halstedii]
MIRIESYGSAQHKLPSAEKFRLPQMAICCCLTETLESGCPQQRYIKRRMHLMRVKRNFFPKVFLPLVLQATHHQIGLQETSDVLWKYTQN